MVRSRQLTKDSIVIELSIRLQTVKGALKEVYMGAGTLNNQVRTDPLSYAVGEGLPLVRHLS